MPLRTPSERNETPQLAGRGLERMAVRTSRFNIYLRPRKSLLCRYCYDLRYESQREDKMHRALRRAQKIRKRLDGSANMMEPLLERPKGMHHDTYMRMFREHQEAEMEQLTGMREWLETMERKLN
jgi:hypothetical protein